MHLILISLLTGAPVAHADDADADEFGFIEEGEKNRAIQEADRAPSASHFLGEDDDEVETWAAPQDVAGAEVDDDIDSGRDLFASNNPAFESADPEEDMEGLGPDLNEREPLGDHFPLTVTRSPLGTLVAELPVLVARNPADLEGDLWVVADVYTDGVKITESRHLVTAQSTNELGPTYVWIKATVPAQAPAGTVEMKVFAAPPGKKEAQIFARTTPYRL